ncbi:MAG: cobaltochelatase subunit CobN, partial [Nitrosospira sp.]|nr:cobaltochelatase subunit CobN [Nitrosospira sp.]
SFKAEVEANAALAFRAFANRPEPDRVESVANRIAAHIRLQKTPASERRLAILIPDYPSAPGRTGYAVGLDVPSSVLAMLHDLKEAGYAVEKIPQSPRVLLDLLERNCEGLSLEDYAILSEHLPDEARRIVVEAWGEPAASSRFPFRAATFGNVTVALAPDRGRSADRRTDYHDPTLPPRHELVAFGLWLQQSLGVQAIVHVGAHGTLEWLPGRLMTRDNYYSMKVDNVCSPGNGNNLEAIWNIRPTALEEVAPLYLAQRTPRNRYQRLRDRARR